MDLLAAAFQFLLLFEKAEQRLARIRIAQGAVVHKIVVNDPSMDRDAPVETGIDHLPHLIERLFEENATDVQLDLRILEPVELVHDRLHRFARACDRRHPVDGNLQLVEPAASKVREELAVRRNPLVDMLTLRKPMDFA